MGLGRRIVYALELLCNLVRRSLSFVYQGARRKGSVVDNHTAQIDDSGVYSGCH